MWSAFCTCPVWFSWHAVFCARCLEGQEHGAADAGFHLILWWCLWVRTSTPVMGEQIWSSTVKGSKLAGGHWWDIIEHLWPTITGIFGVSGTAGSSPSLLAAIQPVDFIAEAVGESWLTDLVISWVKHNNLLTLVQDIISIMAHLTYINL